MKVSIKVLDESIRDVLPKYQTSGASGLDIVSPIDVNLEPGDRKLVPCGFAMSIPEGYEVQIRSRSGLALKHGISVLNSPGTIDSDYRGEVGVILINLGQEAFSLKRGERLAQMVLCAFARIEWQCVEELDESNRGAGGFGHTGQKAD